MAQKEVIEFVAKVDDKTNEVVPTSQVDPPVGNAPNQVDVKQGLQDQLLNSLQKEAANASIEEAIQSSLAREASLKVLRELQASIKSLEEATTAQQGGAPPNEPPNDIPQTFFDPEDNGEIPDWERLAQEQQDAIDDLIRSFDKVDNGPQIDPNYFDDTTAEFDKTFADMDAVDDTMQSLEESLDKPLEMLGIVTPQLALFTKGLIGATTAVSSLIVVSQLYSSVLAATIENFGELSEDVKRAQAETEIERVQQQQRFANEFGDVLADLERNRSELRESQREFLGNLAEESGPFVNATTSGFTALIDGLNTLLAWADPLIEILKDQAEILNGIFKTISWIAKLLNPTKWFTSDKENSNASVWDNLTAPENFLDVSNIRPKNVNGRDIYNMDDLFKKNL